MSNLIPFQFDGKTVNDGKDKFILRFHKDGQRDDLKIRAIRNRRTLNGELLYLIDRGMDAVDGKKAGAA